MPTWNKFEKQENHLELMNTNRLKKFARETRLKLVEQISARVDYVIAADTPALREKDVMAAIAAIKNEIDSKGKQQLVNKVACTWFNRFVALRYMDVNDYQPLNIKIVSPLPGQTRPQILQEAFAGHIPRELGNVGQQVLDLLYGRTESPNAENEAYRLLLLGACNHLYRIFPFLFENINDYTEILLPDDLTSQFSVLRDLVAGITEEDCSQVECIGWLYQFYISEWNEHLISSKKRYEADELAPATQLFTPKWIVQYMVDNTLGQVWSEIHPDTKVTGSLSFYIPPAYKEFLSKREKRSVEEIKFFEPCVGAGHILAYAFDVLYKIYEEEGYNPSEIPKLIITKNLWGVDIDPGAAQLASFVLMMKGREKYPRFFNNTIRPNIYHYRDYPTDNKFAHATTLGSLIRVVPGEIDNTNELDDTTLFTGEETHLKSLYRALGQRYDVVVTNPPYINTARLEGMLKQYLDSNFAPGKYDLFSAFILRCLELTNENGLTGYMTPFVWMFIGSYEALRKKIIEKHFINNLVQLDYSGFDGATVPICTFTLRNKPVKDGKGSYIRLSDFKGPGSQKPKTLEAIRNPHCGWFYTANQKDFEKIPGCTIGFYLSEKFIRAFNNGSVKSLSESDGQTKTGNNEKYLRLYWEIDKNRFGKDQKWVKHPKGGSFRRWYGNLDTVINWDLTARLHYKKDKIARILPERLWWRKGISWTLVTSGKQSFRDYDDESIFNLAAPTLFFEDEVIRLYVLGLLNTKISEYILKLLNPTLNCNIGEVQSIPLIMTSKDKVVELVKNSIAISKNEWDSGETSWDFEQNELLKHKMPDLEETYEAWQQYWKNKFFQLHKNEEELNRLFLESYGLQGELTPDVPLEDVSILNGETSIENGRLVFHAQEVIASFISYSVGCMFGRYSLDKKGLIMANQGETLEVYYQHTGKTEATVSFAPDKDNIIIIMENEWFEDDIVARFYRFLKVTFGGKGFERNLAFIEKQLGCTVRKYFTREFYPGHIRRYKKRPIYWMFSSPKGHFNVLIYMHRYTPDTIDVILNNYLRAFMEKLNIRMEAMKHVANTGAPAEKARALKEIDKISAMLADCNDYERNILYPLAMERIAIDPDNGVLVNYNCFGKAVKEVAGLNDAKTKKKVKEFDWIDPQMIR